uniref:Major facilitator superfamily (MFS) profile domain-containing protein n=1 Tax=Proboscia inermis TaxID=420281 RepID=A0A7S0GC59_9STRA
MATTFIIQGTVMQKAFGFVDASEMNNADTLSVLLFGNIITRLILPAFASRGIKVPTNYKFAAGTSLGALAILSSIVIEHNIKKHYFETGDKISILWQVFPYMFIGAGEILSFAAAFEIAFVIAPAKDKALASAASLFIQGGISNILCLGLYNICSPFFYNDNGTADITDIDTYVTANLQNYFWLLFAIGIFGVVLNLLPPVSRWLKSIEESKATSKDSFIDRDSLLNDTFSESETMNIH